MEKPKSQKRVKMVKDSNSRIVSSVVMSEVNFDEIAQPNFRKKVTKFKQCTKPLEKPAAKRLKRVVGYEALAEETSKWESLIDTRRKESQLMFPLNKPSLQFVFKEKRDSIIMNTEQEKEIYALLAGAKLTEEKKITPEQKAIDDAMTLTKVRDRSKHLWKKAKMQKILETRIGDKIFLRNKSKSKKTHRLMKREKMRDNKNEFKRLLEQNPQKALEVLERLDLQRVQERMSLRHKSSKWLHTQSARAANDIEARKCIKENEELRRELLEKLDQVKEVQKKLIEEDDAKKLEANEAIKNFLLNDVQRLDEATEDKDDFGDLNPTPKRLMFRDKIMANKPSGQPEDDANEDFINVLMECDLETQFMEAKVASETAQEEAKPKKKPVNRPGWGRWTGPGIIDPVPKVVESEDKLKPNPKKRVRSNVIYHEGRDINTLPKKCKVTSLPYPFTNVQDYEEFMSKPIGRQFVPETSHIELISPPMVTKAGTVIDPIGEEALIRHENRKSRRDKKKRKKANKEVKKTTKLRIITDVNKTK